MPHKLDLFHTNLETEALEPVGSVIVQDNGDLTATSDDPALLDLLSDLSVTKSLRGEPVEPDDPKYHLAVADSIGRASLWEYTAEPASASGSPLPQ
jgi:hypothetical protein